jgi:hypothetical protein
MSLKQQQLQHNNLPLMDIEEEAKDFWGVGEVELYGEMSPSMDVWKKFEILPTPPSSPEHESSCADDDDLGSQSMWDSLLDSQLNFADLSDALNTKLIQDCMWSAPQPIPGPEGPKKQDSKPSSTPCPARLRTESGDVPNRAECVDPTSVFPFPISAEAKTCIGRSQSLITAPATLSSTVAASSSVLDTPSPSESGASVLFV